MEKISQVKTELFDNHTIMTSLKSILKDTLKVHDQLLPFNQLDEISKIGAVF